MAKPNAVVSQLIRLEPPLDRAPAELLRAERGLSVELDGGRRARLDPANPLSPGFAQLLDSLSKQRRPVYLEIDPVTSAVTRLLIPHVARIVEVREVEPGLLNVELVPSQARHLLRSDLPEFAELEKQAREAVGSGNPVIVTEDDAHNIIDIRFFQPAPEGPQVPIPQKYAPRTPLPRSWVRDLLACFWYWPWWPWWWWRWFHCLPMTRAQQVFDAMKATSCNPLTIPPPCIPFLYPDDGCWARAHEMCRLMINMGLTPRKVWIQGNLHVATRNNPYCFVDWGWHVAPTLCVRGPWFFLTQKMVIDPSLFDMPVSEATWKGVQDDVNATLTPTDASIYYLWGMVTDPAYTETNSYLAYYRLQLQNRSIAQGPPPYANCP